MKCLCILTQNLISCISNLLLCLNRILLIIHNNTDRNLILPQWQNIIYNIIRLICNCNIILLCCTDLKKILCQNIFSCFHINNLLLNLINEILCIINLIHLIIISMSLHVFKFILNCLFTNLCSKNKFTNLLNI